LGSTGKAFASATHRTRAWVSIWWKWLRLVKASKMNMVVNNDGSGGLYQANSPANPNHWRKELRDRNLLGAVDLLMTNPPFGSKIPITDPKILEEREDELDAARPSNLSLMVSLNARN
jgi:type I restriction-modification system DNA methylase subunit